MKFPSFKKRKDTKDTDLLFEDAWLLRYWANRKTDFEFPPYLLEEYGSHGKNIVFDFHHHGYLSILVGAERCKLYTIPCLKKALEKHNIKPIGKKEDLIQQIADHFSVPEIEKDFPLSRYILTEKGEKALAEHSLQFYAQDRNCMFPIERLRSIQAALISQNLPCTDEDVVFYAKQIQTQESNLQDLEAYRAGGIQEYEFRAKLSERTCERCGALDGKHFLVSNAKMGVNFPPLHADCHCTTVCYDPDDALDWYNSGLTMPKRVTYEEWYEQQVDKNIK